MWEAKIILDSIAPCNKRLTTIQLTYPRFIHCFSEDTDILCKIDGQIKFLPFKEAIDKRPEVAAFKDGKIWFEQPSAWIQKNATEVIKIESEQFSMAVTPEHRMFVGTRINSKDLNWSRWHIATAAEMFEHRKSFAIKKAGHLIGKKSTLDSNLAKLVGFFIGDGTLPKHGKQAVFYLKKQRKIDYLHKLLSALKIEYNFVKYADGTTNTRFNRLDLFKECLDSNINKKIPEIFFSQDSDIIDALFDGLRNSDGSTKKDGHWEYNTFSDVLANQMQAIALLNDKVINLRSYTNISGSKVWKFILVKNNFTVIRKDKIDMTKEHYIGNVYCCTVSSGLLVVRRNNIAHVSGNCELLTHRQLTRNAASSRAIPIDKMIKMVEKCPAAPINWGRNQKGMQAVSEIEEIEKAKELWNRGAKKAVLQAKRLKKLGLHKQIVNRVLEPYMWMTTLISATEWDNLFLLRRHPDAQPEFHKIANMAYEAIQNSEPVDRTRHLPFIDKIDELRFVSEPTSLFMISAARCARLSYLTQDGVRDYSLDIELAERLLNGSDGIGHLSPFEHQAWPLHTPLRSGNFEGWEQYRKVIERQVKKS